MPATRRRRIIRWTVLAVVAPVALLASYISAWLCVSRAVHEGLLTVADTVPVHPVFRPLVRYCDSPLPGARALQALWWKVNPDTMETSIFPQPFSPVGPLAPRYPETRYRTVSR